MSDSGQAQLVLSVEASAPRPGAALARAHAGQPTVLIERYVQASPGRAEGLLPAIRDVFSASGERIDSLAALAVVDGPGSYTGLRVGLGLARGLAFVDDLPVAAVGSLELIAEAAEGISDRVCAVLDAGRDRMYVAGLERCAASSGSWSELHPPVEAAVTEIHAILRAWGGSWCVCGDETLSRSLRLDVSAPLGRAGTLARIGAHRLIEGRMVRAEDALPRYVGATGARANRAGVADGRVLVR